MTTEKKPAEGLTRLRQKHKWSLKTLAELIGVTPATIWQWERDEGKIKSKQLKQLSEVFSEDELCEAFPDKFPNQRYQDDSPIIDDEPDYTSRSSYSFGYVAPRQQSQPQPRPDKRELTRAEEERIELLHKLLQIIPKMTSNELRVMLEYANVIRFEYR